MYRPDPIEFRYAKRNLAILSMHRAGVPTKAIAETFGLKPGTVWAIWKGAERFDRRVRRWRNVVEWYERPPPSPPVPPPRPPNHPDFGYHVWTPADQAAEFARMRYPNTA